MAQKLNLFFRRYSTPAMWAAGGLTLLALILSRLSLSDPLANALHIAAFLLAGSPILFRAVQGLRFQVVGIECLVSIAVIGACWIGEFSEAAIVTFLFQFGSFLEQKTMAKTRSAIKALTELAPATAWRLTDGEPEEIDADEVEEGNLLLVKTGGQIAADGTVVRGDGYVNEASITGESQPRHKTPGAPLYAGTILESGTLVMEAVKVGEDTTFSKIIQLVEEAQDAKSPVERFIDRFARYYTPAVVVMAALTLIFTRNLDMAILMRLSNYLLELSAAQDSLTVTLPLSMKELAAFLDTTPETLSRRIRYLEIEGILTKKRSGSDHCPRRSPCRYQIGCKTTSAVLVNGRCGFLTFPSNLSWCSHRPSEFPCQNP